MFGLIRKKKVMDAIISIAKDYDSNEKQPGMEILSSFYYCCGNMNCANYIWDKIGCKGPIMLNGVPQDGTALNRRANDGTD